MLGPVAGRPDEWTFFLRGKHPSARDFITLGNESRLGRGLCHWIEQGFEAGRYPDTTCQYRFWTQGGKSGDLTAGLIRDSRDGAGRRYPLLVMGTGPLPGWEKRWDILTAQLEAMWTDMILFSNSEFAGIEEMRQALALLVPPMAEWWGEPEQPPISDPGDDVVSATFTGRFPGYDNCDGQVILDLTESSDSQGKIACYVRRMTAETTISRPKLAFLGGSPGRLRYRLYHRPLRNSDFSILWRE